MRIIILWILSIFTEFIYDIKYCIFHHTDRLKITICYWRNARINLWRQCGNITSTPSTSECNKIIWSIFWYVLHWINRKEKWAYCYRVGLGINTNIYVKAFHRVFKYQYLKGKYNKRVDKCLLALRYDRDKPFGRIIKLAIGKTTHKIHTINMKEVLHYHLVHCQR